MSGFDYDIIQLHIHACTGIVARIIWTWTTPSRSGCSDGKYCYQMLSYPIIGVINHWNGATCLAY